jgi:hypothetical protein
MIIENPRNDSNLLYHRVHMIWIHMIRRCYNKLCHAYKNYGNKGCYVNDRWRILNNFIDDIDKIDGFDYDLFINGKIALDKDSFQFGNKEYSLEKCRFISLEENNKYKPNQQYKIKACDLNNKEEYIFYNQSEFARQHNLSQSKISQCANGKRESHKNWIFEKV